MISEFAVLDRKDSYFQKTPTKVERNDWFFQSIIPLLGLVVAFCFLMILYEIPTTFAGAAAAKELKKAELDELNHPKKPFEGCIRVYDFHRYLDRPEEDLAFFCDASMAVNNESLFEDTLWI